MAQKKATEDRTDGLATRGGGGDDDQDTWRGILGRITFLRRFHTTRPRPPGEKHICINLDFSRRRPPHRFAPPRRILTRTSGRRSRRWRARLPNLDSIRPQNATGGEKRREEKTEESLERRRGGQDSFRFNGLVRLMEDGEKSLNSAAAATAAATASTA